MNNTKTLLEEVLKTLPWQNKFSQLRFHINKAIYELEHIERKEIKKIDKETVAEQWRYDIQKQIIINPTLDVKNTVNIIDQMIAVEQQKLENLKKKPAKPNDDQRPIMG